MKYLVLTLLVTFVVAGIDRNKIYMRTTDLQDQANAASGYVYTADSVGPTSYVNFNSGGHPLITLGESKLVVEEPVHAPVQYFVGHGFEHPQVGSYQAESHDGNEEDDRYVEEDGKKYDEANHSSKGEKGSSGYKSVDEYDKGSKGSHADEGNQGYYDENGANKNGHYDVGEHHASNNEAFKGAKGGSFGEAKSHKKGSKTNGYHKVYHKDEYKKDHSFYDEADKKGHYEKYDNSNAHHSSKAGGYKKGGNSDSAYESDKHGKKGYYDKGLYIDDNSGFKGEEGTDKYYTDQSGYSNKGGQQSGKSYGYNEGGVEKY